MFIHQPHPESFAEDASESDGEDIASHVSDSLIASDEELSEEPEADEADAIEWSSSADRAPNARRGSRRRP